MSARHLRTRSPTKSGATVLDGQSGEREQDQSDTDGASWYSGGMGHSDDINNTPRARRRVQQPLHGSAYTQALNLQAHRVDMPPNPTPSMSSMSSQNQSTTSKRSRSPVKSVQDLGSLEIPVYWDTASTAKACSKAVSRMCPGSNGLVDALGRIVNGHTPYIPAALREELEDDDDFECSDSAFYTLPEAGGTTLFDLRCQLKQLRRVVHNTGECQKLVRSEPAWNEDVHKPMLSLATENTPDVRAENVTCASIARPFLPQRAGLADGGDAATSGKMVDYVLALQLPQADPLRRRIATFLPSRTVAGETDFINQTAYRPLKYAPAGVFVETKADSGSADEGRTQLGLWVAAWFRRIEALRINPSMPLPMLPLLLVLSDTWDCYFACRVDNEIRIVGPLQSGSTANLASAYRLYAVLEELSRYVNKEFRQWVEELVEFDKQMWLGG
ncbi:hypothetical protein SPBR_03748 [Sporothrix brasiliensis 5110]|uniref:PD-(D/E)XK nuclease-like domain-containing protein n=1 Tax=Sporothrix brasiliensis 5110 TaxID=1398154 RepID=A0A0C2FV36_9PEZI|nr:uncharacterized protein SPBR_03748 [Sporothrix brasiliensis 5110]KIH94913.1 hypothetical protein SPBR_03748 [Sporothrix brasiliensis 5110]